MRIEEVFKTVLSPLTEALRMDSRMAQLANSAKNEFRFGIEYEFHVDTPEVSDEDAEEQVRNDPDAMDQVRDNVQQSITSDVEEWFSDIADFIGQLFDANQNDLFEDRNDFKRAANIDEDDEDSREQYAEQFEFIINLFKENVQTFDNTTSRYTDPQDGSSILSSAGVDVDQMREAAKEAVAIELPKQDLIPYEKMVSLIESGAVEKISMVIEDLHNLDFDDRNIRNDRDIINLMVQLIMDEASVDPEIEDYHQRIENQYIENLADNFRESNDDFENLKRVVEDQLNSSGIEGDIEDIMPDGSVDQGVEVITKPLPFDDTMDVMEEMFDIIREVGSTSNQTGMHVNISHKSFEQGETPDPLKVTALMDIDFYQGQTNADIVKYTARNANIRSLNQIIDLDDLEELAKSYIDGGFSSLEERMKRKVTSTRSQGINWTHILSGFNSNTRRIEFRFFGGEGYERRKGEINKDLLYLMAVVKSITDESFKPEDYKKGVIRILSRLTRNKTDYENFAEFVNYMRRGKSKEEGPSFLIPEIEVFVMSRYVEISMQMLYKGNIQKSHSLIILRKDGKYYSVDEEPSAPDAMKRFITGALMRRFFDSAAKSNFSGDEIPSVREALRLINSEVDRELSSIGLNPYTPVYEGM